MTASGQTRKCSLRADVFRFAPDSALNSDIPPCPKGANAGSEHTHSITSSARAKSIAGTSRPRVFAVFRLIVRGYLDYSSILKETVAELKSNQGLRERLAVRIRHVIVDEYQDVSVMAARVRQAPQANGGLGRLLRGAQGGHGRCVSARGQRFRKIGTNEPLLLLQRGKA
jgi:UvrD/REP helicase N-terminal domain